MNIDIENAAKHNCRCVLFINEERYGINEMVLTEMTREDAIEFAKNQVAAVVIEPCGIVYAHFPQEIQEEIIVVSMAKRLAEDIDKMHQQMIIVQLEKGHHNVVQQYETRARKRNGKNYRRIK
jgi:hypothetical protein